jgi:hypothetical protein
VVTASGVLRAVQITLTLGGKSWRSWQGLRLSFVASPLEVAPAVWLVTTHAVTKVQVAGWLNHWL